jgi:hypothetical protein
MAMMTQETNLHESWKKGMKTSAKDRENTPSGILETWSWNVAKKGIFCRDPRRAHITQHFQTHDNGVPWG